jgi:hypothetical protein
MLVEEATCKHQKGCCVRRWVPCYSRGWQSPFLPGCDRLSASPGGATSACAQDTRAVFVSLLQFAKPSVTRESYYGLANEDRAKTIAGLNKYLGTNELKERDPCPVLTRAGLGVQVTAMVLSAAWGCSSSRRASKGPAWGRAGGQKSHRSGENWHQLSRDKGPESACGNDLQLWFPAGGKII